MLSGVADVGASGAVESRLEQRELARHADHAEQLRDALELDRLHHRAGLELATAAQLALVLRCSETRASRLLNAAQVLVGLPGAFASLDAAVLTVEQSWVVVELLGVLDEPMRLAVWERVLARLQADAERGVQRPPARLSELLRRWVLEADPASAQDRRRRAEEHADVTHRQRDDGLVDVFATGLTAPNAAACLGRIHERSAPFGASDDRTAGKRRCRRHHRIKQFGWHKERTENGVRWTSPTGRTWLSPAQHQPPMPDRTTLPEWSAGSLGTSDASGHDGPRDGGAWSGPKVDSRASPMALGYGICPLAARARGARAPMSSVSSASASAS